MTSRPSAKHGQMVQAHPFRTRVINRCYQTSSGLIPTFGAVPDGGDDVVGIGSPGEGLGLLVMLLDEAVDGGLKVDNGVEDAVFQPATGQLGEEALDRVKSRA